MPKWLGKSPVWIYNFIRNKCKDWIDVFQDKRSGWSSCKCFYKKARLRPGSYAGRNRAQGRPRERQAGAISSVISFHHYLVTNIVWALNSILIKTVYVMCKIYLGVGVPLWRSAAHWTISSMWRKHVFHIIFGHVTRERNLSQCY